MEIKEHKLKSGRVVKTRPIGVSELYRVQGSLPNLTGGTRDVGASETMRAAMALVLEITVEPKFYFDVREFEARAREPLTVPAGCVEMDLSPTDFWDLVSKISDEITVAEGEASPLSETANP